MQAVPQPGSEPPLGAALPQATNPMPHQELPQQQHQYAPVHAAPAPPQAQQPFGSPPQAPAQPHQQASPFKATLAAAPQPPSPQPGPAGVATPAAAASAPMQSAAAAPQQQHQFANTATTAGGGSPLEARGRSDTEVLVERTSAMARQLESLSKAVQDLQARGITHHLLELSLVDLPCVAMRLHKHLQSIALWKALCAQLPAFNPQIFSLTLVICNYKLAARFLDTAGVPLHLAPSQRRAGCPRRPALPLAAQTAGRPAAAARHAGHAPQRRHRRPVQRRAGWRRRPCGGARRRLRRAVPRPADHAARGR